VVISVADNTNAALRITQTGTAPAIRVEDSANPDSTPFIVDATGNVGIGTASPTRSLSVLTTANPIAQFQGGSSAYIDVTDGTGTLRLQSTSTASYITAVTNVPIIINTNNTERVRVDATGNVLVGRTTSTVGKNVKLDVNGAINASAVLVNGNEAVTTGKAIAMAIVFG
jgi:hypothetical protein